MFEENSEDRRERPTQRDELPVEQLIQNFELLQSLKLTSQCSKDYARYWFGFENFTVIKDLQEAHWKESKT